MVLLLPFKIVLIIEFLLIIGNYIRSLCWGFVSIKNREDIKYIKKAKSLLYLGSITYWVTVVLIKFGEGLLYGKTTEYSSKSLLIMGIFFLILTTLCIISGVVSALRENSDSCFLANMFKNLVGVHFSIALIMCLSSWILL